MTQLNNLLDIMLFLITQLNDLSKLLALTLSNAGSDILEQIHLTRKQDLHLKK